MKPVSEKKKTQIETFDNETVIVLHNAQHLTKVAKYCTKNSDLTIVRPSGLDSPRCVEQSDIHEHDLPLQQKDNHSQIASEVSDWMQDDTSHKLDKSSVIHPPSKLCRLTGDDETIEMVRPFVKLPTSSAIIHAGGPSDLTIVDACAVSNPTDLSIPTVVRSRVNLNTIHGKRSEKTDSPRCYTMQSSIGDVCSQNQKGVEEKVSLKFEGQPADESLKVSGARESELTQMNKKYDVMEKEVICDLTRDLQPVSSFIAPVEAAHPSQFKPAQEDMLPESCEFFSVQARTVKERSVFTQPTNLKQDLVEEHLSTTSIGQNSDKAIESAQGLSDTRSLQSLIKLQVAAQKQTTNLRQDLIEENLSTTSIGQNTDKAIESAYGKNDTHSLQSLIKLQAAAQKPTKTRQDLVEENLSTTSIGQNTDKAIESACGQNDTRSLRSLIKLQVAAQKKKSVQAQAQESNLSATREMISLYSDGIHVQSQQSIVSSYKYPAQKTILTNKVIRLEKAEAETARQGSLHVSWADEEQKSVESSIQKESNLKSVAIEIPQQKVKLMELLTERQPCLADLVEESAADSSIQLAASIAPSNNQGPKMLITEIDLTTQRSGEHDRLKWDIESAVSSIKPSHKPPIARSAKKVVKSVEEDQTDCGRQKLNGGINEDSEVSSIKLASVNKMPQKTTLPIEVRVEAETARELGKKGSDDDIYEHSQMSSLRYASAVELASSHNHDESRKSDQATDQNEAFRGGLLEYKSSASSSIKVIKQVPPMSPFELHKAKHHSEFGTDSQQFHHADFAEMASVSSVALKSSKSLKQKKPQAREQLKRMMTSKTAETKKAQRQKSRGSSMVRDSLQSSLNLPSPDKDKTRLITKKLTQKFTLKKQTTKFAKKQKPLLDQESSAQSSYQFKVEESEQSSGTKRVKKRSSYKTQVTKVARKQKVTIDQDSVQSSLKAASSGAGEIEKQEEVVAPKIKRMVSVAPTEVNIVYEECGLDLASATSDSLIPVINNNAATKKKPQQIMQAVRQVTKLTDMANGKLDHTMDHESQLSSLHQIAGEIKVSNESKKEVAIDAVTVAAGRDCDRYSDFKNEAQSTIEPDHLNYVVNAQAQEMPMRRHTTNLTSDVHPFRFDHDEKIRVFDDNCTTLHSQVGQRAQPHEDSNLPIQIAEGGYLYAVTSSDDFDRAMSQDAPDSPNKVSLLRLASPCFENTEPNEQLQQLQQYQQSERMTQYLGIAQGANSVFKLQSAPSDFPENNLYISPSKVVLAIAKRDVQDNPTFREASPYKTPFEVDHYVPALSEAPVKNAPSTDDKQSASEDLDIQTELKGKSRMGARIERVKKVSDLIEPSAKSSGTKQSEGERLADVQTVQLQNKKVLKYERRVSEIQAAPSESIAEAECYSSGNTVVETATQGDVFVGASMRVDDRVSEIRVASSKNIAKAEECVSSGNNEVETATKRDIYIDTSMQLDDRVSEIRVVPSDSIDNGVTAKAECFSRGHNEVETATKRDIFADASMKIDDRVSEIRFTHSESIEKAECSSSGNNEVEAGTQRDIFVDASMRIDDRVSEMRVAPIESIFKVECHSSGNIGVETATKRDIFVATSMQVDDRVSEIRVAPIKPIAKAECYKSSNNVFETATQRDILFDTSMQVDDRVSEIQAAPIEYISKADVTSSDNNVFETATQRDILFDTSMRVDDRVSEIRVAPSEHIAKTQNSSSANNVFETSTQRDIFVTTNMRVDHNVSGLSGLQNQAPAAAESMKHQSQKPHKNEVLVSTPRNAENQSMLHYATDESELQFQAIKVVQELAKVRINVPSQPTTREVELMQMIQYQSSVSDLQIPDNASSIISKAKLASVPSSPTMRKDASHCLSYGDASGKGDESNQIWVKKLESQNAACKSRAPMKYSPKSLLAKSQDEIVHALSEATAKVKYEVHKSEQSAPVTEKKATSDASLFSCAESYVAKLLKVKPNQIKGVKSKQRHIKSIGCLSQALPPTRRAEKSRHIASGETPSEFTEVLQDCSPPKALQAQTQQLQPTVVDIEIEEPSSEAMLSTQRDISIDGVIRHLYRINNSQNNTNSQTQKYVQSQNVSRQYGGTNGDNSTIFKGKFWNRSEAEKQSEKSQLELATVKPKSESSAAFLATEHKILKSVNSAATEWFAAVVTNSYGEVEKQPKSSSELADLIQENQPNTSSDDECKVEDWRAGVQIRFAVTSPNSSSIQLIHNGDVVDTKSIAFSLRKISSNYEAASLKQFCQEWIMPCIAIKTQEYITAELQESPRPSDKQLYLQVHGEMLSELIFKQFKIADERPASAFTLAPHRDNQDEARFYTQDLSQMEETPSQEQDFPTATEEDHEIPLQLFAGMKDEATDDYLLPFSENATTMPAQMHSVFGVGRLPLDRSATQIERTQKENQEHSHRPALSTQNKSMINDL